MSYFGFSLCDGHLALHWDPDRFLDERVQKYLTPNPFIFLPFNAGPRICLGQQVRSVLPLLSCPLSTSRPTNASTDLSSFSAARHVVKIRLCLGTQKEATVVVVVVRDWTAAVCCVASIYSMRITCSGNL